MDKNKLSEIATQQTELANLAEWRARSIRAVSRGLTHLRESYNGNPAESGVNQIAELFYQWAGDRKEKLDEIASTARAKATEAVQRLVED